MNFGRGVGPTKVKRSTSKFWLKISQKRWQVRSWTRGVKNQGQKVKNFIGHCLLSDGQCCKVFEIQICQIHIWNAYRVLCVWNKLQKYFVFSEWSQKQYFKYNFQKYFVFNTLPKSIFYNCGDGDWHVGIYASADNWRTCYTAIIIIYYLLYGYKCMWGYVLAPQVEHPTRDQEVVCSTPARTLLCNNLRQVVHTLVPLSPSSISWYRCKKREGNGRLWKTKKHRCKSFKPQSCERVMLTKG